jgi:hypothetical protein
MDDVCRVLLSLGGNPEATDADGNTAMMSAMFNSNGEIVRQLRAMGADPNRKNNAGQSAQDVAVWAKSVYLHELLMQDRGLDEIRADITGEAALAKLDEEAIAHLEEDKQWFQQSLDLLVEYCFQKATRQDMADHDWNRPMTVRARAAAEKRQAEVLAKAQASQAPTVDPTAPAPSPAKRRGP